MTTAAKHTLHNLLHPRSSHTSGLRRTSTKTDVTKHENAEQFNQRKEEEKHFIASWEDNSQARPLTPAEISRDPSQKRVGNSSKHLKCNDFKLIKILGTGKKVIKLEIFELT